MAMNDTIWHSIRNDAHACSKREPILASFFHVSVLNHASLDDALAFVLASHLESRNLPAMLICDVVTEALQADPSISVSMRSDIDAWRSRDPACRSYLMPLLYFKGFHALQAHRIVHWLWQNARPWLAWSLHNQVAGTCDVDIHPGARFGAGIMIDHATGLVAGETVVVGDCVSMLHSVTLGGSGTGTGSRHPTIGSGVLISAGAKVLGPVTVGDGAKIGAGSVVLEDVPAHTSVAGVPARVLGRARHERPAVEMDQDLGI